MALLAKFKPDETVPDYLAEYYTKQDDGSHLLNEGLEVENVGGLRKALGESKAKGDKLLKVAKQFGKVTEGTWEFESETDPDALASLQSKYENLAKQLTDADGKPIDVDKMVNDRVAEGAKERIEQERANHAKVLQAQEAASAEQASKLQSKLQEVSITQAISQAILTNKGKGQYLTPHVAQLATLDDDLNVVLMKDGRPIMGKDGSNQSVGDYVAELKTSGEWDDAFHAERASGGGSDTTQTPGFTGSGAPAEPSLGASFV